MGHGYDSRTLVHFGFEQIQQTLHLFSGNAETQTKHKKSEDMIQTFCVKMSALKFELEKEKRVYVTDVKLALIEASRRLFCRSSSKQIMVACYSTNTSQREKKDVM
jgi:hypothetical protein